MNAHNENADFGCSTCTLYCRVHHLTFACEHVPRWVTFGPHIGGADRHAGLLIFGHN